MNPIPSLKVQCITFLRMRSQGRRICIREKRRENASLSRLGFRRCGDRRGVAERPVDLRGAGKRAVVGFGAFCDARRDGRPALLLYSQVNAVYDDSYLRKSAELG